MGKNQHVVPSEGAWVVKGEGRPEATSHKDHSGSSGPGGVRKARPTHAGEGKGVRKMGSKRIFISHASKDEELADAFVDLLQTGMSIRTEDIFCSSLEGMGIPAGQSFVSFIRQQIQEPAVVIALLSPNYLVSQFCLCELGAAWAMQTSFIPITVPPVTHKDIGGILTGVQSIAMNDRGDLAQMQDLLTGYLPDLKFSHARWDKKRDVFLEKLPAILAASQCGQPTARAVEDGPEPDQVLFGSAPRLITAKASNFARLESDFLKWPSGTIVLGVWVQEKGEGIRHAPNNKYILAHMTGEPTTQRWTDRFSVAYGLDGKWRLVTSNANAKGKDLDLEDSLAPGWHQLVVAWSADGGYMAFDNWQGQMKRFSTAQMTCWPQLVARSVNVGCWCGIEADSPDPASFCETKLWRLRVYREFIDVGDSILEQHLSEIQKGTP